MEIQKKLAVCGCEFGKKTYPKRADLAGSGVSLLVQQVLLFSEMCKYFEQKMQKKCKI